MRANYELISKRFKAERAQEREAVAARPDLENALPVLLEAIDDDEKLALHRAGEEVYIGFHELGADKDDGERNAAAPTAAAPAARAALASIAGGCDHAPSTPHIHFPWMLEPLEEGCPIPPDLAEALGRDATQMLCEEQSHRRFNSAGEWWSLGLPSFARMRPGLESLYNDNLEKQKAWYYDVLAMNSKLVVKQDELIAAQTEGRKEDRLEVEELRKQLSAAEAKTEALQGVIERFMQPKAAAVEPSHGSKAHRGAR